MTPELNSELEALLKYLKRTRGIDFTGYKRSSLMRRVNRRMQAIELQTYGDYQDYLEVDPEEFLYLFDTLLINVTGFFRDRPTWEAITQRVLPQMLLRKTADQPIRIWSAGCASGQEAFTLAMLLGELLGLDEFRDRVKIYATDMDEDALSQARFASYSAQAVEDVPAAYLGKYFDRVEDQFIFRKDLRRSIIFGKHNLVQDAPISRIDLLSCRNTLMYFNSETQAKTLNRFHFALVEEGVLVLGKAETLLSQNSGFKPIDLKQRIFGKTRLTNLIDRFTGVNSSDQNTTISAVVSDDRAREIAFDSVPLAQLVVDANGTVVLINERARNLLNLSRRDVGRPLRDLELSYRLQLRSMIDQVHVDRRAIVVRDVEWTLNRTAIVLEVQTLPLIDAASNLLGVSVTFNDMSRYKQLQQNLEHSNQALEMSYEELQSTNEELETTNEELQSTVEELETTNEVLQATNEELETMNEEMQATNEELHATNQELQQRSTEVHQFNGFLKSILTRLHSGATVLDLTLHVNLWNEAAEELWGLRTEEVYRQHFFNLDIGLSIEQLRQPIRNCLNHKTELEEIVLDATNQRGRAIQCKVSCSPLLGTNREVQGVILLMEPLPAPAIEPSLLDGK